MQETFIRTTDYHAKLLAHQLVRRRPSNSDEKLAVAVAGAQVDMNPHQVDAALFAFASPLSKGALLADEVGLGKTIEAGLVISQRWAEGKRRILSIAPSNLRKQWHQEMNEKFFIPCTIIESKPYNAEVKAGNFRPFDRTDSIVICSYQFARNKASDVHATAWDLVVIDEAHRLRNVYKPSNVIANTLKIALAERNKLLLTATPLQNSLLELYGLVSFIDEHTFGDLKSFREQFGGGGQERTFQILKERLKPICHRTLRRQVTAYVPYTKRHAILEEFSPDEAEDRLYNLVTAYLQRDNLQALPASQRSLMTLVLRKLLASSTFAIAGALTSISNRLQKRLDHSKPPSIVEALDEDYEALDETAEEWSEDEAEPLTEADQRALELEIAELREFATLATSIEQNAKGRALLKALEVGFAKAREFGADEKAIIFTESRKTQSYLLRVLADSPFADHIVLFNGTNTDPESKAIYQEWLARHSGSDRVTGSKTADMRSALVDYFREQGKIMIATEARAAIREAGRAAPLQEADQSGQPDTTAEQQRQEPQTADRDTPVLQEAAAEAERQHIDALRRAVMEVHAAELREQELRHAREVTELQESQQAAADKAIETFAKEQAQRIVTDHVPEPGGFERIWRNIREAVNDEVRQQRLADEARRAADLEDRRNDEIRIMVSGLDAAQRAEINALVDRQGKERADLLKEQANDLKRRIEDDERARQIAREYEERQREALAREREGPERDPRAR